MRQSFSKKEKLSQPSDIRRVLRSRQNYRAHGFSVHWQKLDSGDLVQSRFGVLVSAKLIKGAVKRNRMKRLVREFLRQNKNKFRFKGDFIIRAGEYKILKYKELEQTLGLVLGRAGIF